MRRLVFAAALVALASPALAQSYTVTLTSEQLNVVANALAKQPYEQVYQTVSAITDQIKAQQQAVAAAAKKAEQERIDKAVAEKTKPAAPKEGGEK